MGIFKNINADRNHIIYDWLNKYHQLDWCAKEVDVNRLTRGEHKYINLDYLNSIYRHDSFISYFEIKFSKNESYTYEPGVIRSLEDIPEYIIFNNIESVEYNNGIDEPFEITKNIAPNINNIYYMGFNNTELKDLHGICNRKMNIDCLFLDRNSKLETLAGADNMYINQLSVKDSPNLKSLAGGPHMNTDNKRYNRIALTDCPKLNIHDYSIADMMSGISHIHDIYLSDYLLRTVNNPYIDVLPKGVSCNYFSIESRFYHGYNEEDIYNLYRSLDKVPWDNLKIYKNHLVTINICEYKGYNATINSDKRISRTVAEEYFCEKLPAKFTGSHEFVWNGTNIRMY